MEQNSRNVNHFDLELEINVDGMSNEDLRKLFIQTAIAYADYQGTIKLDRFRLTFKGNEPGCFIVSRPVGIRGLLRKDIYLVRAKNKSLSILVEGVIIDKYQLLNRELKQVA